MRYHILNRDSTEPAKFAIDAVSGQVKAIVSFEKDAGRVYGFDVKATDKRGANDGRSAIANVFVSSYATFFLILKCLHFYYLKKIPHIICLGLCIG